MLYFPKENKAYSCTRRFYLVYLFVYLHLIHKTKEGQIIHTLFFHDLFS